MRFRSLFTIMLLTGAVLSLTGCSSGEYVRHLASDACLIVPRQSTKKDLLAYLGEPDRKLVLPDNSEKWIYYQTKKSLLRKTPYIGDKMGSQTYDTVFVIVDGEVVKNCTYRLLTEEEFQNSGIKDSKQGDK